MDIVFKDIKNYEGYYQISNTGIVKSLSRVVMHLPNMPRKLEEKILQEAYTVNGYSIVSLWKEGKGYNKYVHKLVATAFIPNPTKLPEVNHEDGNKTNNIPSNLKWCTRKYNVQHALTTGLISIRGNSKVAKLSNEDRFEIAVYYVTTEMSTYDISYLFNVGHNAIWKVLKNYIKDNRGTALSSAIQYKLKHNNPCRPFSPLKIHKVEV